MPKRASASCAKGSPSVIDIKLIFCGQKEQPNAEFESATPSSLLRVVVKCDNRYTNRALSLLPKKHL